MDTATDDTMWASVLHLGVIGTFLKAPHIPPRADRLKAAKADAAIIGFPFDAMCISRTGANYGPKALREASDQFSTYNANLNLDLRDHFSIVDCGDIAVVPGNPTISMAKGAEIIGEILGAGALPMMLGGDHSVTIAGVRAYAQKVSKPGLILIDQHFDTASDVGGEELSHCCPITRAVEAGFDPTKIAIVATGGWMNPKSEYKYIKDQGIKLFPIEQVIAEGAAVVAKKALQAASDGTNGIYLTVDIDSVDAAYAPGTGVPTPGGLTSREILVMMSVIGQGNIGAMDLVEVSPSWDHDGITTRLGCRILLDFLAARTRRS